MASPASSSTSSSSSSSSIHHASLVDPANHSPALLELIDIKVSRPVIEYVVDCVVETVDYAMGRPSSSKRGRSLMHRPEHAKFSTFVTNVITRAEITTPTILAALVYIDRARPHLHIALEEWALERVILGAIIVASKYLNDSTLKNVHWALCTGVFGKRDVGRIEREYLDVLNFELGVSEADLLSHYHSLMAVAVPPPHYHPRTSTFPPSPQRHHRRSSSIPELDPSSPHSSGSSDGSASPATPPTPITPPHVPATKSTQHALPTNKPSGKSFQTTTLDLLRAFPIPIPTHRSGSHPIRLSA